MIEKVYTFRGVISRILWLWVLLTFAALYAMEATDNRWLESSIYVLTAAVFLSMYGSSYLNARKIKERPQYLRQLANEQAYIYSGTNGTFSVSPSIAELGKRDITICNGLSGKGWSYADYSYAIYRMSKHGNYKAQTIFYSIVQIDLARPLPNMLFDSAKTHKRQFKKLFDKSQVHSLEGNFDSYFTTYFPMHYTIDALSIISPEVMQAMINASDYDIEISHDSLYLYRPLVDASEIPDMVQKGIAIKEKLMNNILTYRDERLPAFDGRKDVSIYGYKLLPNPYRLMSMVLLGLAFFAGGVYLGLLLQEERHYFNEFTIQGLILMAYGGYSIVKAKQQNKQQLKNYHKRMKDNHENRDRSKIS